LSGAVTPASGQVITSGVAPLADPNVSPEPAGTYVDFVVPMPSPGSDPGGITFTATASGFAPDSDPAVVPAHFKDFTPPAFSPTLTLTATTGQVTWPAVASGVTVQGSTDNVNFSTVTGTVYPTAATNRNAFGGATKFLFVRAFNASNVYTPTFPFSVPPQDPTVPTITKVTAFTLTFDFTNQLIQLDYTISNFPSGGSIQAYVMLDGVDQGALLVNATSSTQTTLGPPVTLSNSGVNEYNWAVFFEVLESNGQTVAATSKTLYGVTYY
jgi:hypothetical protein